MTALFNLSSCVWENTALSTLVGNSRYMASLAKSDKSSEKIKFQHICDPPEDPTVPMSQCPNVPGGSATKLGSYRCNAILERKCHNNAKCPDFDFNLFVLFQLIKQIQRALPPPLSNMCGVATHTHIYIINWISFMCFW